jgi:hypothetical protein
MDEGWKGNLSAACRRNQGETLLNIVYAAFRFVALRIEKRKLSMPLTVQIEYPRDTSIGAGNTRNCPPESERLRNTISLETSLAPVWPHLRRKHADYRFLQTTVNAGEPDLSTLRAFGMPTKKRSTPSFRRS